MSFETAFALACIGHHAVILPMIGGSICRVARINFLPLLLLWQFAKLHSLHGRSSSRIA